MKACLDENQYIIKLLYEKYCSFREYPQHLWQILNFLKHSLLSSVWKFRWKVHKFKRKWENISFKTIEKNWFFFFCFFRTAPWAYGSSQDRGQIGVQLLAYTTATATPDPSRVYGLHHSTWQHQTLNPLREAKNPARILMDTSWIHFHYATIGTLKTMDKIVLSILLIYSK